MAPIREVCSPVNSMKPGKPGVEAASKASRKVQHAPVYGPPVSGRDDAVRPASRPAPGQAVDGTLSIKHTSDRRT
jgi:hypothetical protein